MTVVTLDDDDLDDEDRAILAEVSKKGYYHGRPKTQAGPPPTKIEAPAPQKLETNGSVGRAAFDDFQRKWDRFDDDEYLQKLERETLKKKSDKAIASSKTSSARPHPLVVRQPAVAEFKVLLVGDSGVGKSALVKRHLTGEFERKWARTSEEEVHQLRFATNCGELALNVWIAAGGSTTQNQGRKGSVRPGGQRERFYTQGHAAILMFDVTSRSSYGSVPNWQREIKQILGTIPTVLLGNKVDAVNRQVKASQIQFHKTQHLQYYDVSVADKHNFERPFLWLARRLTNQPELQFVGPFAKAPCQPLAVGPCGAALRSVQKKQVEALSVAVGSYDDNII